MLSMLLSYHTLKEILTHGYLKSKEQDVHFYYYIVSIVYHLFLPQNVLGK